MTRSADQLAYILELRAFLQTLVERMALKDAISPSAMKTTVTEARALLRDPRFLITIKKGKKL